MTEDFASDMHLLRDLLLLAQNNGHQKDPAWRALRDSLTRLEGKATALMPAIQDLKEAFNPANRDLMMGLWAASFVDPVDPPQGEEPTIDTKLDETELIRRAKVAGKLLSSLLDDLKSPHRAANDHQPQGDELRSRIADVHRLVEVDLEGEYWQLNRNLKRLLAAFQKTGGAGGESTYWPSNYVSSSSSSSSGSGYP